MIEGVRESWWAPLGTQQKQRSRPGGMSLSSAAARDNWTSSLVSPSSVSNDRNPESVSTSISEYLFLCGRGASTPSLALPAVMLQQGKASSAGRSEVGGVPGMADPRGWVRDAQSAGVGVGRGDETPPAPQLHAAAGAAGRGARKLDGLDNVLRARAGGNAPANNGDSVVGGGTRPLDLRRGPGMPRWAGKVGPGRHGSGGR